jgi:hypothetical protein
MKKLVSMLAMLSIAFMANSQNTYFTIARGMESKFMDHEMIYNGQFLGVSEGSDLWLTHSHKGARKFAKDNDWNIAWLNKNLASVFRVDLPYTHRMALLGATVDDEAACVLLVDSSESKSTRVFRAKVALSSKTLIGGKLDTLQSYTYTRKDRCVVWGSVSPNGEYMGVLSVITYRDRGQYKAEAAVYDAKGEQVWKREHAVGNTDCIYVTNDGALLTLASRREKGEQKFEINVIDDRNAATYTLTSHCDPLQDMRIVNVVDGNMLCAGRVLNQKGDLTTGVAALSVNIADGSQVGFNMRLFDSEDRNVLLNRNTKKANQDKGVESVLPVNYIATPTGAAVAYSLCYTNEYINANGSVSESYGEQGLHIVSIDSKAEVLWARNLRRNDVSPNEKPYVAMYADGDEVCVVKSENRKMPDTYEIGKEVKEFVQDEDKSNLAMYRIDAEGKVSKTVLEKKSKHGLVRSALRNDGSLLMILKKEKKSRPVTVQRVVPQESEF